jgi:hypothetical protein
MFILLIVTSLGVQLGGEYSSVDACHRAGKDAERAITLVQAGTGSTPRQTAEPHHVCESKH